MNIRSFRKQVREMKTGEEVYINAINLSLNGIEQLKEYIADGTLVPNMDEVKRRVVEQAVPYVMKGEMVCPQMLYTRA